MKRFQCSSDRRWPSLVLLGKIVRTQLLHMPTNFIDSLSVLLLSVEIQTPFLTFAFTSPHDTENGKPFRPRQGARVRPSRVGIKSFDCAALAFLWWPNYTNWLKNRQQLVHPMMRIDVEHRWDVLATGESPAGALQESGQLRILPAGCPLTRSVIIELLQVFSDFSTDDTDAGTSFLLAGLWPENV